MAWDYDWQAGPAGSLVDLSDYCTMVRVRNEWSTGRRGSNPLEQHRHGAHFAARKFVRQGSLVLETAVRDTNAAGAVTHADGKPGHQYENLSILKDVFGGTVGELVRLQRTAPHIGASYLDVEQLGEAIPTQTRHIFGWPLTAPRPFWIGAADTANTQPTLTVAGDAPIDDAVCKFLSGTDVKAALPSGDFVQIEDALPAGGVSLDLDTGACVRITGGADWSDHLRRSNTWELNAGANTVTVTGGTMSFDWYTKWK